MVPLRNTGNEQVVLEKDHAVDRANAVRWLGHAECVSAAKMAPSYTSEVLRNRVSGNETKGDASAVVSSGRAIQAVDC